MKLGDVRLYMRVVPFQHRSFQMNCALYSGQPFLYVVDFDKIGGQTVVVCNHTLANKHGDCFLPEDLCEYQEPLKYACSDKYISSQIEKNGFKLTGDGRISAHFDDDYNVPQIEQVIFNPPATIVKWTDGTKTVVKVAKDQKYDEEAGVAACYMNKIFGSHSKFRKEISKKRYEKGTKI